MYGLDSHPARPFVVASSSRDTTLRFWTMHGQADVLKVRTAALFSCSSAFVLELYHTGIAIEYYFDPTVASWCHFDMVYRSGMLVSEVPVVVVLKASRQ